MKNPWLETPAKGQETGEAGWEAGRFIPSRAPLFTQAFVQTVSISLAQRREGGLEVRGLGKVRGPSPTPRQFCFEFSRWRVFTLSTFAASFNLQAKPIPHLKIVWWDLASFNALFIWKRRKVMWCGRIGKVYFHYRLINLNWDLSGNPGVRSGIRI